MMLRLYVNRYEPRDDDPVAGKRWNVPGMTLSAFRILSDLRARLPARRRSGIVRPNRQLCIDHIADLI
jgi:hypothetical protein